MLKTTIKAATGLHARPASLLVKEASSFKSDVFLLKDDNQYNCKSIISIMSSNLAFGDEVSVQAVGDDSDEAEKKIYDLINSIED